MKDIRKPIIAVDFDGTITLRNSFPDVCIELNLDVVAFIKACHQKGCTIILWTCRHGKTLDYALEFCKQNNIPIDYANENAPYVELKSPKIFADYYIDDRALNIGYTSLNHIYNMICNEVFVYNWIPQEEVDKIIERGKT